MAALLNAAAQAPGTISYSAEIEISKSRLLSVEQYELARTMVPTQFYAKVDFFINQVRAGHPYEYRAYLWADLGADSETRATNVHLTFPDGQTRIGTLSADGDLEIPGWTDAFYTFSDLKAALPPGSYHLHANFTEGAGTNYTAQLPDYTDNSFPPFVPGYLTWDGTENAPLVFQWETIPDVDYYEIYAGPFPDGPDVYSDRFFPVHPDSVATTLSNIEVSTNFYRVSIEAEREVGSGQFVHEFLSSADFYFIPARLVRPSRTAGAPFGCSVVGGDGTSYVVEGSTNLVDWTPLDIGTVVTNGCFPFTDFDGVDFPCRFYRAVWSPAP